ncbi:ATP-grasp domain-containing protein [Streptomyces coeruleoprunus]|uniref:ATP-grasp domain-containing protein n=1 Tax=Streptomyces coeruleoprunus TaxID=285563 RepID=A0ABV9XG27_9ACTN
MRRTLVQVSEALAGGPAVLVALDDITAVSLDRLRAEGPRGPAARFLLPEPPPGLCERVADKAELAETCRLLGVPHPRTLAPSDPDEAAAMALELGLPVVAKWSRPWLLPVGAGLRGTTVARSVRRVRELYARGAGAGSRLLLQRMLPGGRDLDWFFHAYCDSSGRCRVAATGWKVRSWPDGAGPTAVGTWTPNPVVERMARDLVGALGYRGIADLDFRLDPVTGTYHLLDFDPRPGAQFRLFSDPWGLDVVRALHLDLTGRPVPEAVPVYGRRFVVENHAALSVLTSPRPRLRGPSSGRSGGSGPWSGLETAWFAADDPAPAAAMVRTWAAHLARRAWAALRRRWRGRATEASEPPATAVPDPAAPNLPSPSPSAPSSPSPRR